MGKLNIISGNILNYLDGMDAVVNSANEYMISGSGVCGSIYKAAGNEKLEKYCKDNFSSNMKTNEIRITPGFNLGLDIIHVYAPKVYGNKEPIRELVDTYSELLFMASEKRYTNIISVSLGTGVHGYKHEDVVGPVLGLVKHYLELPNTDKVNFTLVLPNDEIRDLYINHKPLTYEEFRKLPDEEKGTRYVELSPEDKFKVRVTM